MAKPTYPLDTLKLPIVFAQVKAQTDDGATVIVTLALDDAGKLKITAEAPPSADPAPAA